jgi:Domain of unknown function (DUF4333)
MNSSNSLLMSIAIGAVSIMVVACASKQALSSEQQVYAGKWIASDGTFVEIFLDGSGSAKGANTSVEGGSTTIAGQTLKIGLGPIEQKYQISQEPKETDGKWTMKLNGIAYVKEGGTAASSSKEAASVKTEAVSSGGQGVSLWDGTIKQQFKEKTGISVKKLSCPADATSRAKQGVACEVTDDSDRKLTITIKQDDDGEETISWKADKGLISLKEIEANIRSQLGKSLEADCHGKYRIAHTGDKFNCDAKDSSSNKKVIVKVVVKSEDGQVEWETK